MAANKKRPTIYDLAEICGVSPGTVSRVLNNKDRVKTSTRERVLEAAKQLGIKPQSSARRQQIAIVNTRSGDTGHKMRGYMPTLSMQLSFALANRNAGIIIPEDPLRQLEGYFLDGIVAVLYDQKSLDRLRKIQKGIPIVSIDNFLATDEEYVVSSDHYESGRMVAQYFIDRGMKRLAFAGSKSKPAQVRKSGYVDAIKKAGLPVNNSLICHFDNMNSMHPEIARIVRGGADSLFVPGGSLEAVFALHILQYIMGLKIPGDLSFIGGENPGVNQNLNPPITSFVAPLKEMADQTVDLIIRLMNGEAIEQKKYMFSGRIIERDSVLNKK